MKRKKTPTQRTLDELEKLGFTRQNVEKFNHHTKRRIDLFGCIDIIAAREGFGVLGIQATAGGGSGLSNVNARRVKCVAERRLRAWLKSGGRFELWNWRKLQEGNRMRWRVTREEIKLDDLGAEPPPEVPTKKIRRAMKPLAEVLAGGLFK